MIIAQIKVEFLDKSPNHNDFSKLKLPRPLMPSHELVMELIPINPNFNQWEYKALGWFQCILQEQFEINPTCQERV